MIQTTKVFTQLQNSNKRFIVFQGGSRCFIGSTLVKTIEGHKPIKDIKLGDVVYSYDSTKQNMTSNRVIDRFTYEEEQPLLLIQIKNDQIICTPKHKFLFQGEWVTAFDIARRRMERGSKHERKIFNKQFRKVKGDKLQDDWTTQNNETSSNEERQIKEQISLSKDNDFRKWQIFNKIYSQISGKSIHSESLKQTTSKGDCKKIPTLKDYCKYVSQRIQSIFMYNKNNPRSEQQKKYVARSNQRYNHQNFKEISLEEIESIDLFISKDKVYDIEVENTHSYCITLDNIIVHNSGKTYNIVIWWIIKLLNENHKVLTICRETMPSLKNSVYRDFIEILRRMNLFDIKYLNKGDMTYQLGTNLIEFRNLDEEQKVRGPKRDYLYINEANEDPYTIFKQLNMRTKSIVVMDYNPSDEFHWIYDKILTDDDCDFFKSTYLDNPFLPDSQIKEIEKYKATDPNYWRIYGLGERGVSEATIFKNWELCDTIPESNEVYYGLDFGFNDPNALIQVTFYNEDIYLRELLYKSQLTSSDLILELKAKGVTDTDTIYGDNSRPETIQEIYRGGFNIHSCTKGKGSIKAGIDWLKKTKVYITKDSLNLIKEMKSYKWKVDKNENVLDEPVDVNNHLIDALRYSLNDKIHNTHSEISILEDVDFLF